MRAIDGDALIDKYGDWYTEEGTEEGYIGTIKGIVDSMPTIEPKRKNGKWIHEIVNNYTEKTYCSECGESAPFVLISDDYYGVHVHGEDRKTNFCPNCGADMR